MSAPEDIKVIYSLTDPVEFAQFLQDADVRLVRSKYLAGLIVSKRPLPRRQEAEWESFNWDGKTETALVSHEEVESWATGGCDAIICSISHAWETREHPDPCRFQLQEIVNHAGLFQAAFEADVWIFYDYISLFQFERDPGHQQSSFGKAMDHMQIMYAHECSMTFRIEGLTPDDLWEATKLDENELVQVFDADSKRVLAKPLKDLVENRTDYVARGWCRAEMEWSSLRTVNLQHRRIGQSLEGTDGAPEGLMTCRIPMTPAKFREQMDSAKFTHRSDAASVIRLQEKIFHEKVTMCESLVLEGLADSQFAALAEALPLYQKSKSLKLKEYSCGQAEAKAFGEALATSTIERLEVWYAQDAESGPFMGKAIAMALKRNESIGYIGLTYNRMGLETAQALAEALKVNNSVQNINFEVDEIGPEGVKALAEALRVNRSVQNMNLESTQVGPDGAKALEAIEEALERNRAASQSERLGEEDGDCDQLSGRGPFDMPMRLEVLAGWLISNRSDRILYLYNSGMGPKKAEVLAEALKTNTRIRQVHLAGNALGDQGAKAIAAALKINNTIEEIYLAANDIGSEGAQALAEALRVKKSRVRKVNVCENSIGEEGLKALREVIESKKNLGIDIDLQTDCQRSGGKRCQVQ